MKKLIAFFALLTVAMPTIAAPVFNQVPEPGTLALLGMSGVAMVFAKRIKK